MSFEYESNQIFWNMSTDIQIRYVLNSAQNEGRIVNNLTV